MKHTTALKTIMWISVVGVLFSGYLSYTEIFRQVCALGNFGTCSNVFSIPACVYGFVMYLIVLIVSLCGLRGKKN
jgi:uncharacterized membrane protein